MTERSMYPHTPFLLDGDNVTDVGKFHELRGGERTSSDCFALRVTGPRWWCGRGVSRVRGRQLFKSPLLWSPRSFQSPARACLRSNRRTVLYAVVSIAPLTFKTFRPCGSTCLPPQLSSAHSPRFRRGTIQMGGIAPAMIMGRERKMRRG